VADKMSIREQMGKRGCRSSRGKKGREGRERKWLHPTEKKDFSTVPRRFSTPSDEIIKGGRRRRRKSRASSEEKDCLGSKGDPGGQVGEKKEREGKSLV